jgi:molecular chaperone GrpE
MPRKGKSHEIPIEADEPQAEPRAPGRAEAESDRRTSRKAPKSGDEAAGKEPTGAGERDDAEEVAMKAEPMTEEEARNYEQALDHLRRLQAEFANYKKRVDRERVEVLGWGQRALVEKLLPVLDDFDRALAALEGENTAAAEGMALIREKLMRALADAGLKRIETEDAAFDPEVHEALMTLPVEPERVGQVISELVAGFTFKGHLVRPARVQVGVDAGED